MPCHVSLDTATCPSPASELHKRFLYQWEKVKEKYTQSWLKPSLTWEIIWDFNAVDQTWILMMIFFELAVTGLKGDADLSLLHAQGSAVPCNPTSVWVDF